MGAVSAFTDRNLSMPTSEQLLKDGVEAISSCLDGVGAIASCLDGVGAVASCKDGVQSSCFLLGWCSEQLLLAWMVCFCASFSQLCWCHGGIS